MKILYTTFYSEKKTYNNLLHKQIAAKVQFLLLILATILNKFIACCWSYTSEDCELFILKRQSFFIDVSLEICVFVIENDLFPIKIKIKLDNYLNNLLKLMK
jgi:hypothetical protein